MAFTLNGKTISTWNGKTIAKWNGVSVGGYDFVALASDTFAGADDTAITAHSTDGGAQAVYGDISVAPGGDGLTWTLINTPPPSAKLSSNILTQTATGATFCVVDVGETDYRVRLLLLGTTGSGTHYTGIMARATDDDNCVLVFVDDGPTLFVRQIVSGTPTDLHSGGVASYNNKVMELRITGTSVVVYYDGSEITTETIDSGLTATNVGVVFNNAATPSQADNFLVYQ